jgi:predicted glycosyltransferase
LRDFAETKGLFEKRFGFSPIVVGKHAGESKVKKVFGSFKRIFDLNKKAGKFDVKISVGGDASSIVAKLRGKFSITFDDNEKAPNWRYSRFSDLAFWPDAIPLNTLKKQGFTEKKLFQYNGYKEDVYIADFKPDPDFLNSIPFEKYVLVRPENIQANYVDGRKSIVPELLKKLSEAGHNILFLPRYEHDKNYTIDIPNIYIPAQAINGLDACYYADFVLTGAGTLAREAACLGVPAISFYAGKELLTVDQDMIKKGKMFFSRNPDEIMEKMKSFPKTEPDLGRSKRVKKEVIKKLEEILK